MSVPRCPVCNAEVARSVHNGTFPFCSDRCRTLDLGNWLDGRYHLSEPTENQLEWPTSQDE